MTMGRLFRNAEEREAAWLGEVADAELPETAAAVVRWLVMRGDYSRGGQVVEWRGSGRALGRALGVAAGQVSRACGRLVSLGLLARRSDRWGVSLAALSALADARRSAASAVLEFNQSGGGGGVARCCAPLRAPSLPLDAAISKKSLPMSLPARWDGGETAQRRATARNSAQQSAAERFAAAEEWRGLRAEWVRGLGVGPLVGEPAAALRALFLAGVAADVYDDGPQDRRRFLAAAYDSRIGRSPVGLLRHKVCGGRWSPTAAADAWAVSVLRGGAASVERVGEVVALGELLD